ncbi:right-handed parallel beta-helix repeat-containing protein [Salinibacterium sp. ZJ450]|uniref:right-handed parallel beta-helix repeat-containing protein n=1 Tax=Salinibacterium sp. ZJ450 TaxID=2708338 RepID=UPI00141E7888|nr:right-handed parallel beta-helix repeat-containing protein [Salinibacterium sp. ZJ450]
MIRACSALAVSALFVLGATLGPLTAPGAHAAESASADKIDEVDEVAEGRPYPGDPTFEAALVADEDARLVDVRSVISSAPWRDIDTARPYLIATPRTNTLVLVPRAEPYTLQELAGTATGSVRVRADGAYLISDHIAVQEGATLLLQHDGGMRVRLVSGADYFTSIVVLGGSLLVRGAPGAPVDIGSVDHGGPRVDADTSDGRAYLRVLGGHAEISDATVHDLGFWSGETGGLALTGIEPPDQTADAPTAPDAAGESSSLPTVALTEEERAALAVQGTLRRVKVDGNAFGIFASNAESLVIDATTVSDSLVSGILFHRFVTRSTITNTTSRGNAVDGFAVARASTGNAFSRITSTDNGRNGMTLDGRPLADGPSATGTAVRTYGDNVVFRGTFADNTRYGVEINGGESLAVRSSTISGNEMGIVLANEAQGVRLTNNELRGQARQGIAVRETVSGVYIGRNSIVGGETGIYLRNAVGDVVDNTISHAAIHGITLVGSTTGSTVTENTVTGAGPSAIYADRSRGAIVERNEVDGWTESRSLDAVLAGIFQPLTIVWVIVMLIVVLSVVARARARAAGIRHPYESHQPLSSYSRGVVERSELEAAAQRSEWAIESERAETDTATRAGAPV